MAWTPENVPEKRHYFFMTIFQCLHSSNPVAHHLDFQLDDLKHPTLLAELKPDYDVAKP
jgi:hypothetical protein